MGPSLDKPRLVNLITKTTPAGIAIAYEIGDNLSCKFKNRHTGLRLQQWTAGKWDISTFKMRSTTYNLCT
ncbi:hypothetical protein HHUSO_G21670 [Huso huso]|uniref:Uncharacterized protein n=1 Tax=Huso huso TaxID=61971 RepID=A0ABR0YZF7_HUSHU